MSLNAELSELFQQLASLMELKGESVFKVIAFQKVSRIIRESNFDLKQCVENGTLCDIEGVGNASRQIIEEFIRSGKSTVLEEISADVPPGLVPMLSIEGLGPKTIHLFWKTAAITSLPELEQALANGTLKGLKGIGEKKLATITAGIAAYKSRIASDGGVPNRRTGIADAFALAEPILASLREIPGVQRAEIAGSLRRQRETIADVDFVAAVHSSDEGTKISEAFSHLPGVVQILVRGPSKCSVKLANGMQADLRIVPDENFGAALLYFTGSKEHNVKIRGLAQKKGWTLNEWGLYPLDEYEKAKKQIAKPPELKPLASRTETDIYKKLGLPFIDPELREDRGEIDAALAANLPKIITRDDIRGDLHTHTTASDGTAGIEEMAEAARSRGYEYLAITDHSKALAMTHGLSVDRLLAHIDNIHRIGSKLKGITLLAGSEVDILADGRMDYDDDILKQLDIVIASPHLSLKQDEAKATARLLRAIENPYVNIIGHPTGRLINGRDGLPLNLPLIFQAAARTGTALEINAGYPRLDLNDINARNALAAGVTLSINTDAHSVEGFDELRWGLSVARRAAATPDRILNCMPLKTLRAFIARKRP